MYDKYGRWMYLPWSYSDGKIKYVVNSGQGVYSEEQCPLEHTTRTPTEERFLELLSETGEITICQPAKEDIAGAIEPL